MSNRMMGTEDADDTEMYRRYCEWASVLLQMTLMHMRGEVIVHPKTKKEVSPGSLKLEIQKWLEE